MKRLIALVAAAAAASALAQGAPPSNTSTQGFFRPSDLAWPAQPVIATQPGVAPGVQLPLYALPDPVAAAAAQTIEQIREDEAMRIEEIQMDHLERENERASRDLPFLSLGGGRYR
jgi:hypothetical protein